MSITEVSPTRRNPRHTWIALSNSHGFAQLFHRAHRVSRHLPWHQDEPALGLDEGAARRAPRETDRVAYVRYLYRTAMTDPSHFDLYVDTAAIEPEACVDLLEEWVRNRALRGASSNRTGPFPKEANNGSTS
jgi:hypothetical protein